METKYINGVECVFPISQEITFEKFNNLLAQALFNAVQKGKITLEELDQIIEEEKDNEN